ncbi:MAG TPA: 1-deoxy-D-xylulose-5-phosphate reductoisomerase [Spirochaetales bacterium]|nr:1-deoxy-D-xylulose-5-phosphate reductoisomerase [Spirochaetales bacterium]
MISIRRVIIIGATGSIGRQAIDVVARHPDRFSVVGLSAHSDEDGLVAASCHFPGAALCLSSRSLRSGAIAFSGIGGLSALVRDTDADIVLNAASGAAGLSVSFDALSSGKDLALANKETVVMAGRLAFAAARRVSRLILPVDSEHSAIFNMIERFGRETVRGVVITASGGAFRDEPLESLPGKKPVDALAHPTWSMGAKITVDSATMANKGLEVIEAARLFGLTGAEIDVVLHPESRVHSFIRARDGSLYAQMSRPDMRLPILNALAWPESVDESVADMDPCDVPLRFSRPDPERYPLLRTAYDALASGEGSTDAYNAANEVAVAAFMDGAIRFTDIARVVSRTLERAYPPTLEGLEAVLAVDADARRVARSIVKEIS